MFAKFLRGIGAYDYEGAPWAILRHWGGGRWRIARWDNEAMKRKDWASCWRGPLGGRYERDTFGWQRPLQIGLKNLFRSSAIPR
jgi:hypothetical protein